MSRLLHAAARGARIETCYLSKKWQVAWAVRTVDDFYDYRIHPDDTHLQYGPISTALREMAENFKYNSSWEHFLANAAANEFTMFFDSRFGEPDYPLFYLFLAEALADEGM
jgi:hypothetical protein